MTAQDAIGYLDFPCEPCDRNSTHEPATWVLTGTRELTSTAGTHTSRPIYLCDACADKIQPQEVGHGVTINLQPIGGWQ